MPAFPNLALNSYNDFTGEQDNLYVYIEEFVKLPCPGQLQLPGERDLQLPDPDNIRRRKHSMAYVTAVVGAGGKTGYIREKAQKNALMGKKTAVMTTTHILEEPDSELIRYIGLPDQAVSQNARKLIWPGDEIYRQACLEYDEVLVEADGAKHYPLKIPAHYEPVIPENVSEIVVVMSGFALGRDFREVCFRGELADPDIRELMEKDPVVTRELVSVSQPKDISQMAGAGIYTYIVVFSMKMISVKEI